MIQGLGAQDFICGSSAPSLRRSEDVAEPPAFKAATPSSTPSPPPAASEQSTPTQAAASPLTDQMPDLVRPKSSQVFSDGPVIMSYFWFFRDTVKYFKDPVYKIWLLAVFFILVKAKHTTYRNMRKRVCSQDSKVLAYLGLLLLNNY